VKKRLPEIQPAHESSRVTVAQAAAAFRKVRGSRPKPGLWDSDSSESQPVDIRENERPSEGVWQQ